MRGSESPPTLAEDSGPRREETVSREIGGPAMVKRSQQSPREYSRFLRIALNSTTELEYHLVAARNLAAVRADSLTLVSQVIEVRKMLYGLLRYLKSRSEDESRVRGM